MIGSPGKKHKSSFKNYVTVKVAFQIYAKFFGLCGVDTLCEIGLDAVSDRPTSKKVGLLGLSHTTISVPSTKRRVWYGAANEKLYKESGTVTVPSATPK